MENLGDVVGRGKRDGESRGRGGERKEGQKKLRGGWGRKRGGEMERGPGKSKGRVGEEKGRNMCQN